MSIFETNRPFFSVKSIYLAKEKLVNFEPFNAETRRQFKAKKCRLWRKKTEEKRKPGLVQSPKPLDGNLSKNNIVSESSTPDGRCEATSGRLPQIIDLGKHRNSRKDRSKKNRKKLNSICASPSKKTAKHRSPEKRPIGTHQSTSNSSNEVTNPPVHTSEDHSSTAIKRSQLPPLHLSKSPNLTTNQSEQSPTSRATNKPTRNDNDNKNCSTYSDLKPRNEIDRNINDLHRIKGIKCPPPTPLEAALRCLPAMDTIKNQRELKAKLGMISEHQTRLKTIAEKERDKELSLKRKLEADAKREQQRREIYAVNAIMSELEARTFGEFQEQQNGVPV